eukprot:TRINITY_DN49249_c0_g1_i1.p1 TRINITY_DN49249_c0_g1~~TRINITY_DN49249_c0_g1_i1.p1  ORF type:complete len:418 (+),score=65.34 TRINITY_DN49249_c0_g1_i1:133-1386(+)
MMKLLQAHPASSVLQALEFVRETAAHRALDPLTLERLHTRPTEVGALLHKGKRIEAALHFRSSVVDEQTDKLRLPHGLTSLERHRPDGFQLMPPLSDIPCFVAFVDWDNDGMVLIAEVAVALAAVLPVDPEATEFYMIDHFGVDDSGVRAVPVETLVSQILPDCLRRGRGDAVIQRAAPALEVHVPPLWRGVPREELARWFDHWDFHGNGELEAGDIELAIALLMFHELDETASVEQATRSVAAARKADLTTKELVTGILLSSLDILSADHNRKVGREDFINLIAPSLLANLRGAESRNLVYIPRARPHRPEAKTVEAAGITDVVRVAADTGSSLQSRAGDTAAVKRVSDNAAAIEAAGAEGVSVQVARSFSSGLLSGANAKAHRLADSATNSIISVFSAFQMPPIHDGPGLARNQR